eukprot:4762702-Amphidinium_carterae.1
MSVPIVPDFVSQAAVALDERQKGSFAPGHQPPPSTKWEQQKHKKTITCAFAVRKNGNTTAVNRSRKVIAIHRHKHSKAIVAWRLGLWRRCSPSLTRAR